MEPPSYHLMLGAISMGGAVFHYILQDLEGIVAVKQSRKTGIPGLNEEYRFSPRAR